MGLGLGGVLRRGFGVLRRVCVRGCGVRLCWRCVMGVGGVDEDRLPHALTVFVTAGERRRVLKRLRREHADRRVALLRLLGVTAERGGLFGAGGARGKGGVS